VTSNLKIEEKKKMGRVQNSTIGTNNGAHSGIQNKFFKQPEETNVVLKHEGHSM
jgi:hypothetical protein